METILSFADKKAQLEARIKILEEERNALAAAIPLLKERLTSLRLEGDARSLEGEVSSLQSEKSILEEEISRLSGKAVVTPADQQDTFQGSSDPSAPNGQAP